MDRSHVIDVHRYKYWCLVVAVEVFGHANLRVCIIIIIIGGVRVNELN